MTTGLGQLVTVDLGSPAVTIVSLNRPEKRNALSINLMHQLRDTVQRITDDPRCRVLILRGNGPAFCAGLDLQEASNPTNAEASARALAAVYEAICGCPLVTIAAAHGAAMGGGVGLLSVCDLVVASADLRIGFPEVRRGLVAALVTVLLGRQLPDRVLRELVLLGKTITAEEAREIGLVNRVVALDRLDDEAQEIAADARRGAPGAIQRTKKILDEMVARPVAEDLARALRYHLDARNSSEAAEGIAAFLEKREPRWA